MPSSEVRYQRGDVYRSYDEDILRARRSSSASTSSVLSGDKAKRSKHFGSATSAENAAIQRQVNRRRYNQINGHGEEFLTKKKVEVKTTRNTEKRVQRCIVLEDGRIIEHDDPHIVVDTVEDTQTHEFDHLEDESLAKELQASIERSYQNAGISVDKLNQRKQRRKSLAYTPPSADMISGDVVRSEEGSIVNDTFKRTVNTHDVRENIVRTHAAKDLGSISQKGLRKVLKKQGKVSDYIKYDQDDSHRGTHRHKQNKDLVRKYEKESHRRVVDTEDVHQISRRLKNGQIRSETFRTEKHEVFDDKVAPDDRNKASDSTSGTEYERDEQQFRLTKTRDFTDYYDSKGQLLINGPQLTSHDVKFRGPKDAERWREVTDDRIRQTRNSLKKRLKPAEDAERTDALTKKPLDLNKEERTRKKETDKWLERHFGSDWSLSGGSGGGINTSRFKYLRETNNSQFDANAVRRTMSFSSIPIHYTNPGEKVSRVIKQTTTTIRPGFDKHVVSSVTKSLVPNENERRHKSLEANRPYHSTLTLATAGRPLEAKKHHASATSLLNETSRLTFRQVPIDRQENSPQPSRSRATRVQRLIDEQRSQHSSTARSNHNHQNNRKSYYYGEDPRVQSEPPRQRTAMRQQQHSRATERLEKRTHQLPLYRTELLKTSNKMYAGEEEQISHQRNWRDELSKSYHDISWDQRTLHKEDKTQSYSELPKPSQLFGWTDEFHLHGYGRAREHERSEGLRHHIKRSKSFATMSPSDRSSTSEASYNLLHGYERKSKSYKDTKVSSPPRHQHSAAPMTKHHHVTSKSKKQTSKKMADAVYEFERKIPMQSSILEAQKFKTVIFVSGN